MSDTPENFEPLRKALKITSYEVPPPGYFNNFSSKITSRIERENIRPSAAVQQGHLLHKFIRLLETNPLAAAAFGFSVCGLLIAGIAYSEYQEPAAVSSASVLNGSDLASDSTTPNAPDALADGSGLALTPSFTPSVPTTNLAGGLFDNFDSLKVKQVNFNGN